MAPLSLPMGKNEALAALFVSLGPSSHLSSRSRRIGAISIPNEEKEDEQQHGEGEKEAEAEAEEKVRVLQGV